MRDSHNIIDQVKRDNYNMTREMDIRETNIARDAAQGQELYIGGAHTT